MIAFERPSAPEAREKGSTIETGGPTPMRFAPVAGQCRGLGAQEIARSIAGIPAAQIPPLVSPRATTSRLRADLRSPASSIRCRSQAGSACISPSISPARRVGPDVEWVDTIDYDVDPARAASFYAAIRAYWPDLPTAHFSRPMQASGRNRGPGGSAADFLIQAEKAHGLAARQPVRHRVAGIDRQLAIADWVGRYV